MELTVLAVSFAVLLLLGVPVAFAIGLSSVATILAAGLPMAVVFQRMVGGMQVFSFLAIPFFVFAGELMLYGGIAERIVRLAISLVGLFGGLMAHSAWEWTTLKWAETKPMLGVPEGLDYVPLVIAVGLIVLFSIVNIVSLFIVAVLDPSWN